MGDDTNEMEKRVIHARKILGCFDTILWRREITKKLRNNGKKYLIFYETIMNLLFYTALQKK